MPGTGAESQWRTKTEKTRTKKIIKDLISQVSCNAEFTKDMDTWDEKKSIAKLRELLKEKR